MVSRIDLGPDGGPYVEIDEDAGDLVIRVPNDTVDFDSNDLLTAVLQNATMDGGSLDGVSLASALDADTQEIQNANLQNATLSDALDANNQDLNSVGTASVTALEAENVTLNKDSDPSTHQATEIDIDSDDSHTIFDFEDPVDVIAGTLNHGGGSGFPFAPIRITWEDGSETMLDISIRGNNDDGVRNASGSIPLLKNVLKLEAVNDSGSSRRFGWGVVTV